MCFRLDLENIDIKCDLRNLVTFKRLNERHHARKIVKDEGRFLTKILFLQKKICFQCMREFRRGGGGVGGLG